MDIIVRARTTDAMIKAKQRKNRNRRKRDEADRLEANRLNITVDELRSRRVKKWVDIGAQKKAEEQAAIAEYRRREAERIDRYVY